jgi:hypothetical protein
VDNVKAENHTTFAAKDNKVATLESESKEATNKLQCTMDGYKTSQVHNSNIFYQLINTLSNYSQSAKSSDLEH